MSTVDHLANDWKASRDAAEELLYPLLVCPACRTPLDIGETATGTLVCQECRRSFPWLGHIPVLIEQEQVDARMLEVANSWNRVAPIWRQLTLRRKPQAVLDAIDTPLVASARGRVLEIGCGDGRLFPLYEQKGLEVIGLDYSAGMLSVAATGRFPLLLADAHNVPLPDGTVETVLVPLATIRYLEYERFFNEANRLLKPGGVLAFTAWNSLYNGLRSLLKRHRRDQWREGRDIRAIKEICDPLKEAGFVVNSLFGVFWVPIRIPPFNRLVFRVPGAFGAAVSRDIVIVATKAA
jgi:SAM-dependent methyltransferase